MLLFYETSSIAYTKTDLINGKFLTDSASLIENVIDVPRETCTSCALSLSSSQSHMRIFVNIYGVFADLLGDFCDKYRDQFPPHKPLEIPCAIDGIYDPAFVSSHLIHGGVDAIMEEDGFWRDIEAYTWYLLVFEELYGLCDGDYYFILPMYHYNQIDDRLAWLWQHFGVKEVKSRTAVLTESMSHLLIRSRKDMFIGARLYDCEQWVSAGGSAFWWPSICQHKCTNPEIVLHKRIEHLNEAKHKLLRKHTAGGEHHAWCI